MVKDMLAVLMDGITDVDMMLGYAMDAKNEGKDECMTWFKNHAKARMDTLTNDYNYVSQKIGLSEKVKAGDEIAEALSSHLMRQMTELNRKYSMI